MTQAVLANCPCCDRPAHLEYRTGRSVIGTPWHRERVHCRRCKLTTGIEKTPGMAVKKWNRRIANE